jgi:CBS domain-containing protein
MHLMDGRRVTINDLIDAGLLKVGERLQFNRSRMRKSFGAEVSESGRLRLDDGLEYRSPSRAAMVAANMRAVDGWHAWNLVSSGKSLDALRQEVLDQAVASSADITSEDRNDTGSPAKVHEWLRAARARAEGDDPERISVRVLLSLWGAKDRGDQISRIEADLANHGLATRPDFRGVTLEASVSLITAAQEAAEESKEAREALVISTDDVDDSNDRYIGLLVGTLRSALGGVVSVTPNASLDEAITKMLLNDYSQLAVMSGAHHLRGAVTWQSIARARQANPDARLVDATVGARDVPYRMDLLEVLDDLRERGFIFVRNENNTIAGIVTAADVAGRYGEMANPFILIGQLDRLLRRAITRTVPIEDVIAVCDPRGNRISGHDDMSMGDYERVLENPDLWDRMKWSLDRSAFVARLRELRSVRNDVMHFNPDPLPENTVRHLRQINDLLRRFAA